jgi:tRNA ligase
MAALTPTRLLITSKHAIGSPGGASGSAPSHAEVGEQWIRKYLAQKERTEEQLANVLWENNWTAIAEVRPRSGDHFVRPLIHLIAV